ELGEKWKPEDIIPAIINKERMEKEILSNLETAEKRDFIRGLYRPVWLEEKGENFTHESIYGINEEKLFGEYKLVTEKKLTERDRKDFIENYLNTIVDNRRAYESLSDIVWQDIEHLTEEVVYVLKDGIKAWDREDLREYIHESGYSHKQVVLDHRENNLDPPDKSIRIFHIPLIYKLEGDNLKVTIPAQEIIYPRQVTDPGQKNQKVSLPLYSISLLEFFGAPGPGKEGYMLVPDGSGGLIDINKKWSGPRYQKRIYGRDYATEKRKRVKYPAETIHFPVYGLKNEDQSWLAVIENGASLARVRANVSGNTFNYNRIFANFILREKTEVRLSGDLTDQKMNIYQPRTASQDLSVRYSFLEEEKADYSGMARNYQDYLVDKYDLKRLSSRDNIPLMLELTGSIHVREPVMGIPRRIVKPVTTYSQTLDILAKLTKENIHNINLIFQGWLEGGYKHNYPETINLEKKVGSRNKLKELIAYTEENGIDFYPETGFLNVYNNNWLNGFSTRQDASRFIDRQIAYKNEYNLASFIREDGASFIHSPLQLGNMLNSFLTDFTELGFSGLAARDLGRELNSDFRRSRFIDREEAAQIISDYLADISGHYGLNLLLRGAHEYTLPYTENIVELPLTTSSDNIIDRGIPFLQMVLHGYFNYSGQAFNLKDEPQKTMLKALETGSLPSYHFMGEPSQVTKGTEFNNFYSVYYKDWLKEVVETYQLFEKIFSDQHHLRITEHKKTPQGLTVTTFENKKQIVVNHQQQTLNYRGQKIPALSYKVLNKGGRR
ncbi:MAG: DUF5696 domain-containing protein, partial [Halanaerobiaceae bacterium]